MNSLKKKEDATKEKYRLSKEVIERQLNQLGQTEANLTIVKENPRVKQLQNEIEAKRKRKR